jgi:hypothetical protein
MEDGKFLGVRARRICRDLLFSVKRSEIIQTKSELHVFLAENTKEDVCDFKVEASWLEKSCVVYGGESSPMISLSFLFSFFLFN